MLKETDARELEAVLRRYVRGRVPVHDINDVVQDVLVAVLGRAKAAPIINLQAFAVRAALNAVRRYWKTISVRHVAEDADVSEIPDGFSPERILIGREAMTVLTEAIKALPVRTRDVFALHRFADMTYAEIARHMSISQATVEKHMARAISRLSASVKSYYGP
jgi:RNA polymerase sigma factor (sigma-70 family)